ncbi:MAG: pyridoxamine 5'-phosphate oxidase family protein [Candidatus Thorarchaeota archaeon]
MTMKKFDFHFVEEKIRQNTFGILNTINLDNSPHTSGILYGVSKPEDEFCIYLKTMKKFRKVKNIQRNPNVSFIITFPHHFFRFIPAGTITMNGQAELVPIDSEEIRGIFTEKRVLRMIVSDIDSDETFLRIKPKPKVFCYGVGFNILELRSSHTSVSYSVMIPEERLPK